MTAKLSKLLVAEAKPLCLEDIRTGRRKNRKALDESRPSRAPIRRFFSTVPTDSCAQENAVAILKWKVRAAYQGAVA